MEKTIHVKAFMDRLTEEDGFQIIEKIAENMPHYADDDVFEFDIVLKNVRNVNEEVGLDEEGCRAFTDLEVSDVNYTEGEKQ